MSDDPGPPGAPLSFDHFTADEIVDAIVGALHDHEVAVVPGLIQLLALKDPHRAQEGLRERAELLVAKFGEFDDADACTPVDPDLPQCEQPDIRLCCPEQTVCTCDRSAGA